MYTVHNFNDYSNITQNTNKISTINNKIFYQLQMFQNNNFIIKNNKHFTLNNELLDFRYINYFTKNICFSNKSIQNFYNYNIKYINLLQILLKLNLINQKQLIQRSVLFNSRKQLSLLDNYNSQLFMLSPTIVTEFVKFQINSITNNLIKKNNFTNNIKSSLVTFLNHFLQFLPLKKK